MAVEEMNSEEQYPKIPAELVTDVAECQELIWANQREVEAEFEMELQFKELTGATKQKKHSPQMFRRKSV